MFSENQTDLVELTDKKDSDIEMGEVTSTNNKTHSNSTSHNNNTQNQIEIFLNNINYIISYFNQHTLMSSKEQSSQLNSNYSSDNYSKYLTNADIFNYQLMDVSFRKTITFQFLIVLNSLLKPISQSQKKTFVFTKHTLEKINHEITNCMNYLSTLIPNNIINSLFKDEIIWGKWKEGNCNSLIEKYPDDNIKNMFDIKVSSQHKKEKKKFVFDKINSLYGKYDYQKEFSFNIHDLKNIKMDFSLESIYNPVPFIGRYIERVINDNDVENEFEESEKIGNVDQSFSWKFLRLLSHEDLTKLFNETNLKVNSICETYFNNYKIKGSEFNINFKLNNDENQIKEKITVNTNLLHNQNETNITTKDIKPAEPEKKQVIPMPIVHIKEKEYNVDKDKQSKEKEKDKVNKEHDKHKENEENKDDKKTENKESKPKDKDKEVKSKEKEKERDKDKEKDKEKCKDNSSNVTKEKTKEKEKIIINIKGKLKDNNNSSSTTTNNLSSSHQNTTNSSNSKYEQSNINQNHNYQSNNNSSQMFHSYSNNDFYHKDKSSVHSGSTKEHFLHKKRSHERSISNKKHKY